MAEFAYSSQFPWLFLFSLFIFRPPKTSPLGLSQHLWEKLGMFCHSLCPQILIRLLGLGLTLPGFHGHFILPSAGTQMASYRFGRASKMGCQQWVAGAGSCCVTLREQLTEIIIMGHGHRVPKREPQIPAARRSPGFAALPFSAVFCKYTLGQIFQ